MQSIPKHGNETVIEIKGNFTVARTTLERLESGLLRTEFITGFPFISNNIKNTIEYIQNEIRNLLSQSAYFEQIYTTGPLMICGYKEDPTPLLTYRDNVRTFSDTLRNIANSLYTNVSSTLAAYILVYDTLERFGLKTPFVLIESDDFSDNDLTPFIFDGFSTLGPKPKFTPTNAQIITYSGIDIDDPSSLLIIGHETFHIIDKNLKIFELFCKDNPKFASDDCCADAFVDLMSALYYGPVYTTAMLKHFRKLYPRSSESHLEMSVRLKTLNSLLKVEQTNHEEEFQRIEAFVRVLEAPLNQELREKAKEDKTQLQAMISTGAIDFIRNYFKGKNITEYSDFVSKVENKEFGASKETISKSRLFYMLSNGIPAAVRPTTLLNNLCENNVFEISSKEDAKRFSKLITSSIKKWYVRRYYEKKAAKVRVKEHK